MKRFAASIGLGCLVLAAVSGCVQLIKEGVIAQQSTSRALLLDRTLTQPPEEQMHSMRAVVDQDARAIVEDWDALWQRDRPTRLTRWHER